MSNEVFIPLKIEGSPTGAADAVSKALLKAANGAAKDEAALAKRKLRADVMAGLPGGAKLANAWRVTVYPSSGLANDPAILIVNNAAEIIEAFSAGVTIHAASGNWLAIPAPETLRAYRAMMPKGSNGTFQERGAWPEAVARSMGGRPKFFVERDGRRGFVYVQLGKARKIIGWLVKQSVLGKRIRGTELLDEIAATLPASYQARFNDYLDAELKVAGL